MHYREELDASQRHQQLAGGMGRPAAESDDVNLVGEWLPASSAITGTGREPAQHQQLA
jgi:hypothetical protein